MRSISGSSRGWARVLLVTAVAAATSLVAVGPASAAAATPYGKNLVRNGGAEKGSPGTTVPGWEVDGFFSVVRYGSLGAPTKSYGSAIRGGRQLFSSGPYDETLDTCGSATQFIRIRGRNGAIDHGHVKVRLKARLGTAAPGDTSASVTLQFRDGDNEQVVSNQLVLGPISTDQTLPVMSKARKLPPTTRRLRVQLVGDPTFGLCNGLFDKVTVVLRYV